MVCKGPKNIRRSFLLLLDIYDIEFFSFEKWCHLCDCSFRFLDMNKLIQDITMWRNPYNLKPYIQEGTSAGPLFIVGNKIDSFYFPTKSMLPSSGLNGRLEPSWKISHCKIINVTILPMMFLNSCTIEKKWIIDKVLLNISVAKWPQIWANGRKF